MIAKNMILEGTVTQQGKRADGVVMVDGVSVYVPNTVLGDHIRLKIVKVETRRSYGKLLAVLVPGADRVVPACSVSVPCGGCQLQHMANAAQRSFKEAMVMSRLQRYIDTVPIHSMVASPTDSAFRNKMQLAFGMDTTHRVLCVGLYAQRSHRVVDMTACSVMAPAMQAVVDAVKGWHKNHPYTVFSHDRDGGLLRFLTIRYSYHTQELMVILTVSAPMDTASFVAALRPISGMTSIYCSIQGNPRDDSVMGNEITHIFGARTINDVVSGKRCRVSPTSFMQANAHLVDALYDAVIQAVIPNHTVIDLYCGTGVLTCALTTASPRVIGVDWHAPAIEDARLNAITNGCSATFFCMDAIDYLRESNEESPMTVVLDPPRQGCSVAVLTALMDHRPLRIVYVSCYVDTLGRDLRHILNHGYRIDGIRPFDMFCHTPHVECVVSITAIEGWTADQ